MALLITVHSSNLHYKYSSLNLKFIRFIFQNHSEELFYFASLSHSQRRTMKVVEIGTGSELCYAPTALVKVRNDGNKFGTFYYLKDAIFLLQRNPVTNYNVCTSKMTQKLQLAVELTPELKKEMQLIAEAITKASPELRFKHVDGDKLYCKIGKSCDKIEANCNLSFCIKVYGCFQQNSTGTTFLQYEVSEQQTEKISLLSQSPVNYVPNSNSFNWND